VPIATISRYTPFIPWTPACTSHNTLQPPTQRSCPELTTSCLLFLEWYVDITLLHSITGVHIRLPCLYIISYVRNIFYFLVSSQYSITYTLCMIADDRSSMARLESPPVRAMVRKGPTLVLSIISYQCSYSLLTFTESSTFICRRSKSPCAVPYITAYHKKTIAWYRKSSNADEKAIHFQRQSGIL
jgi:hypothetical protein